MQCQPTARTSRLEGREYGTVARRLSREAPRGRIPCRISRDQATCPDAERCQHHAFISRLTNRRWSLPAPARAGDGRGPAAILRAVAVAPDITVAVAGRSVVIPADAVEWQFARSAGPGGQHVNRTSTKAMLRFDVRRSPHLPEDVRQRLLAAVARRLTADGMLLITSQRHRVRARNMADCRVKLAALVAGCLPRPTVRRATRKPRAAVTRRLDTKRHRSRTKQLRREPDA